MHIARGVHDITPDMREMAYWGDFAVILLAAMAFATSHADEALLLMLNSRCLICLFIHSANLSTAFMYAHYASHDNMLRSYSLRAGR